MNRSAAEVLVAAAAVLLVVAVVGWIGFGLLGVILFGGGGAAVAVLLLRRRQRKSRAAFAEQLPDMLQLLAGNLRVGYGLLQALETAATEMEQPAQRELQRTTSEVRLGRDLIESLHTVAARQASEDFGWIVQAMGINRDVGGDLAEVLDTVAETIRARGHLSRQVSALSAEGRISAYVLVALPFGVGALSFLSNPHYMSLLFTTGMGMSMLVAGGVMTLLGCVWLRAIVRPNY